MNAFAPGPFDFAVYATAKGCAAINLSGSVYTDSFDSSQGSYAKTKQLSRGHLGATGNVALSGSATVNGAVFALNTRIGECEEEGTPGISLSGRAKATQGYIQLSTALTFSNPPTVIPGSQDYHFTSSATLPPGNYGNISVSGHGTLTLSPGVYKINSLTLTGGSVLTGGGSGQVIVNIAGNKVSHAIQFSDGTIINPSAIPLNFQLIYGGTLPIVLSGGTTAYAVVYARNAPVTFGGNCDDPEETDGENSDVCSDKASAQLASEDNQNQVSDWFGALVVGRLDDSGTVAIHYDRSLAALPTITAQVSPAPDAAGWNKSSVVVNFTCSDPIVGIASCSSPVQLTSEGAKQTVTGTVVNRAGASAITSVILNIDKTPPLISRSVSPPPNAAGWNMSSVAVTFACSDALSGIASCPVPIVVSKEGAGTVISGTAIDQAGNTATTSATISLDKTPPSIAAVITPAPNGAGWNNSNVTVTFTCADTLSGISNCPAPVQVVKESAGQVISGTAQDRAGNVTSASVTVNLDRTAPNLTVNSPINGATVALPTVTITGTTADGLSGVASVSCQGVAAAISGSNFSCVVPIVAGLNAISIQARDVAGNVASSSLSIQGGVPAVLSVSPNTGQQGQQKESVVILGQFTHWLQGTTTANFGSGITGILTVNSPTNATAVLNIDPTATLGARSVTLTTGSEMPVLSNGFNVTAPVNQPPVVNAGANQTVTIPNSATLSGTISDDGLPFGSTLKATWSLVSAPSSTGGQSWLKLAPTGTLPAPRNEGSSVFDPSTNRLILFGGLTGGPSFLATNDLWILAAAAGLDPNPSWTQLQPTGSAPAARYGHSAFYDSKSNRMVIFGGAGSQFFNDVWILTNANGASGTPTWVQVSPMGTAPSPRRYVGLAYDPTSNRMMIFGCQCGTTSYLNETWVLTNANGTEAATPTWIQLTPAGALPPGRSNPLVAYDAGSNRLIAFGGAFSQQNNPITQEFNDAWVLTNANGLGGAPAWLQLTPDGAPSSPSQRLEGVGAYNPSNNSLTIAGGIGNCQGTKNCVAFADVWSLKNANGLGGSPTWAELGPTGGPPTPAGFAAYDPTNDRLISFGGGGSYRLPIVLYNDIWVLTNATRTDPGGIPGTVTFSNPTFSTPDVGGQLFPVVTIAAFSAPGSYVLRLTGNDSQLSSTSDVTVTVQSPSGIPALAAAVPNAGQQGQTGLSVTVTGQNTHFVQGTTQVSFGSGITISSAAVMDAMHLSVTLNIGSTAVPGFRDVTVTTGAEVVVLSSGFTVQAGTPLLVSVNPSTGQQGQQNLSVNVTGQFTHFTQGATTATFGSGITVASLTVNTPTTATAVLKIDATSALGTRNVTLATNTESVTLNSGFTVTSGTPVLLTANPNIGQQGQQNLSVTITGQFTHFVQGTTAANFGAGITVASLTISSSTNATALLNIDPAVAPGARDVTLTTNAEVVTLRNGFTVSPGTPALTQVSPAAGQQGQQNLSVTITGLFTHFALGTTQASFGDGLSVGGGPLGGFGPVTVISATSATAQVSINICALTGLRTVTLQTGTEAVTLTGAFSVTTATAWSQISPIGTRPSARSQHTALYDRATNRVIIFGGGGASDPGGITNDVWVLSNANGSGGTPTWTQLNPIGNLPPRRRDHVAIYDSTSNRMIIFGGDISTSGASVPVANDVWVLTNANGLGGPSVWSQLLPQGPVPVPRRYAAAGYDPSTNRLTIFGGWTSNLNSVNDVWVLSNANGMGGSPTWTQLAPTGQLPSPRNASFFAFDETNSRLIVFGGESGQNTSLPAPNAFNDVWILTHASGLGGAPTWIELIPNGAIGSPSPRAVAGASPTPYNTGNNRLIIPGGGTDQGGTSNEVWLLRNANGLGGPAVWIQLANLLVPAAVVDGQATYDASTDRVMQVAGSQGNDEFVLSNSTNLPVPSPTPQLLSVLPNSASLGQSLNATLTGACTSFAQGLSVAGFGAGITVASLTVNNATTATASLNISPAAANGSRAVTLTTGPETVTLGNGFTVTVISNLAPSVSAGANQTVTLTPKLFVAGENTNDVVRFDGSTGALIDAFVSPASGGVNLPNDMVTGADGNLYVTSQTGPPGPQSKGAVLRYSGITGAFIDAFVPLGSGGLRAPTALIFGPDGNLYVSDYGDKNVKRYNGVTGAFLNIFTSGGSPVAPQGLTFGVDGNLYLADQLQVLRYDASGAFLDVFVPAGRGGLQDPLAILFGPDGNLYVSDPLGRAVRRYAGGSGTFIDSFVAPGSGGLDAATGIAFGPDGNFYVGDQAGGQILRYDGRTGAFLSVFVPAGTGGLTGSSLALSYIHFQNSGSIVLNGSFTDDGLPTGSALMATWTKVSGSGAAVFSNTTFTAPNVPGQVNIANTNVGFTIPGTYGLRLTASDSQLAGSSDVMVTVNEAARVPILTSVVPNSAAQGQQNLSIIISGQNTHFTQGTTQVNLGNGILVGSVNVTNATNLTAQIAIDPNATIGSRTLTVTTGMEVVSDLNRFVVQAGTPILMNVAPLGGQQGQQNLSVAIIGQFTHFMQGTTTASFGAGITVTSLTVSSATTAAAVLNIDVAAALGTRNVTLTTGAENASLANGFSVTVGTPALTAVSPNSAPATFQVAVAISGQFTHFVQGVSTVSFGAGITVNTVSVIDTTHVSVSITIASSASIGGRTVAVQTGAEQAIFVNGFSVACSTGKEAGVRVPAKVLTEVVVTADGSLRMYHGGFSITSSVSTDGKAWTPENGTRVPPTPPLIATGYAERIKILTLPDATYRMYFLGSLSPGYKWQIYSARSSDGLAWTQEPGIRIDYGGFFGCTQVGGMDILQLPNNSLRMYYSCSNFLYTTLGKIVSATSTDGLVWTPDPGVRIAGSGNSTGLDVIVSDPDIEKLTNGSYRMYYAGAVPMPNVAWDPVRIFSAVSNDGLTWTSEPGIRIDQGAAGAPDQIKASNAQWLPLADSTFRVYYWAFNGPYPTAPVDASSVKSIRWCTVGPNNPPTVNAGPDQTIALPVNSAALTGTASDDGLPAGSTLTYTWTVFSGPGAVAFSNPTSLMTNAQFAAVGQYVLRLTAFDTELYGYSDVAVSVQAAGTPQILSVSPSTGQQGQQNIGVSISGQNTHFVQGTTTASFGASITVNAVTVTDATHLTATITIPTTAAVGTRVVTVTTSSEVAALSNGFTVATGANQPPVVSAGPNLSAVLLRPQAISGTVTDDGLPNPPGALTINWSKVSGPGTVNFNSPNIPATVATFDRLGKYVLRLSANDSLATTSSDVTVMVGCPVGPYPVGPIAFCDDFERPDGPVGNGWSTWFGTTYNDPTIQITSGELSTRGFPNQAGGIFRDLPLSLPFSFSFDFRPVGTVANTCTAAPFNEAAWGIAFNRTASLAETPLRAAAARQVGFEQFAGSRNVTRYYWNGTANVSSQFPGLPEPIATQRDFLAGFVAHIEGVVNPDLSTTITVFYNDGLNPPSTTFTFAPASGAASAPPGAMLAFGNNTCNPGLFFFDNLDIRAGLIAALSAVAPDSGQQGQSLAVAVTGLNTHFIQGTTQVNLGAGVTATNINVSSTTNLTAQIAIDPTATIGARTLAVTTGTEVVSVSNVFTIQPGTPVLASVTPSGGQQGQQSLPVAISGQVTHFMQGTTTASFGAGITVASLTVNSPTSATAVLNIDPATVTGPRNVTLTTNAELVTLNNGFTVTPGTPALTKVNPSTGQQAQVNLSVSITGQFTHFTQGSSAVSFSGVGISVNSVTVTNPTSLVANISIAGAAALGLRGVTVTTGAEMVSLSNAFSVYGPLVVNPGPDVSTALLAPTSLNGQITEASAPSSNVLTATWSKVSGQGSVTFTNINSASTIATFDRLGKYVLRLTGSDSITTVSADVNVTVGCPAGPYPVGSIAVCDDFNRPDGTVGNGWTTWWGPNFNSPQTFITNGQLSTTGFNGFAGGVLRSAQVTLPISFSFDFRTLSASNQCGSGSFNDGGWILVFNGASTAAPNAAPPAQLIIIHYSGQRNVVRGYWNGTSTVWDSPVLDGPVGDLRDYRADILAHIEGIVNADLGTQITIRYGDGRTPDPVVVSLPPLPQAVNLPPGSIFQVSNANCSAGPHLFDNIDVRTSQSAALLSVIPNSGQQGQSLAVAVTGANTHFVQGTTTASFGGGITLASPLTVTSATSATAVLNIDPAAVPGPRTVTLTTGPEIASFGNGFTVLVPSAGPAITTVSPNSGPQGQGGPVGIVGLNTHFVQGTTQVDFGAGIIVSNITVTCPTCLTVQLQIAPAATVGARNVTVTTGSEVVTLANGFTVLAGTPILTSLNPATGQQGQTLMGVLITGQFTHFTQGTTQVSFGAGIAVSNINVSSATSLTAQLAIDPNATVGARTLTVTTGTEVVSVANVFNVQQATPIVLSLNPGGGQEGQQNVSVAITGLSTHWVQGTTTASFGAGITVTSLTVTSATTATATINIDPAAAPGTRTVTVTTNAESASFTNGFTVSVATPVVLSLNPGGGQQGQQSFSVAVMGLNTHWVQGTSQASFGAGVTVASFTVTSPTAATAVVNIDPAATVGARTVTVTTNSEIASFVNGFTIVAGTPAITQVNPNTGPAGQQNLSVNITGQFTHFAQGTTSASFGAGITVASLTVNSATTATAVINIDPAAVVGGRTVTFTTGSETVSLTNGFTVGATATPVLTQVNPSTAQQAQQNLAVTITGQATHFVQGTTQVSFAGTAVTVNSVSVASPTSLTVNISIAANATTGPRPITVTTGTEVASLANGFAVTTGTNQAPVITILPTWSVTLPSRLTITYTVTDDGLPLGGALTTSWQTRSGPGNVGFQNQTLTSISVGFDQAGTYVLQITATDTQFTVSQNVTVTVNPAPAPPTVSILSPTEGSEVTTQINVTGTVTSAALASWTLEFRMQTDSFFRLLATGTNQVTNGVLGVFDPTLLLNGIALIQLRATDAGGQTSTTGPVSVVLTRNEKIGNFTVSFNDLSVPVAGLPIQVIRTYDSRNKTIGDFGVGWTLDVKTVRITTNGALGDNWNETSSGGAFPTYCLQAVKPHVVTVTFADGTTYEFQPALNPQCQQLVPIQTQPVAMNFTPMGITPPNATLTILGGTQPLVEGSVPGPVTLFDPDSLTTFDPDQFVLTLPDGRMLQLSRQSGLQSMTDLNGNKLTVTPNGITHSSGKSVIFLRDSSGRITKVTDPIGNTLSYTYDGNGDLINFTDRLGNVSTYTYDSSHGLLTIKDPRGVQPIRNTYDNSGRLISHTDAFGNVINYTHNLNTRQEIVTDRLSNITVNEYDTDGNVVKVTDALGGITQRTYDSHDNVLTETNALAKTRTYTYDASNNRVTETDPLGHATTYTYNARNQVLSITDALGRVATNTYDANGNLLSAKDAAGNTTTYTYNGQGLRTSFTDALGAVTNYQYDAAGNLTQQTDPLGRVTAFTYDANGNKLTETKTRTISSGPETLVTSYQYDALDRLVKSTFPDGSNTQTQYNAIGKQSVTLDPLGRQTSYQYDLMGHLTKTIYPDGTSEVAAYDAEGDRISATDRAGRVTTFVYDPLKRLTKTIYPDGASTSTSYDAIGEVTGVTDPRGNTTQYQYDSAGRRTKVIDALTHATSFAYDLVGNQVSMTDASSNTTQYQYDALNRRTATVYSDLTTDTVGYDVLGRTLSKTDQAGKVTQFQYDKLGRLTQVTDALNQLTKYAYDEVGSRISQTDANNHSTMFAYDKLGRRTKRTLPLGTSETMTYDGAGNLASKTDFNGKITTYAYDSSNRLTSKMPDASLGEPTDTFTYTATGQRQSMVDASGTTTYTYDLRDRLLTKATPQGTLTYTYDASGDLTSIRSSNASGASVNYAYDVLNRLSTVTDNRLVSGNTTYTYDAVGNLAGYLYPNGVQSTYTYNQLNRLTNLAVSKGSTLASYSYTLAAAGNRTAVAEFGGRQVNYTYDSLYHLSAETISGGAVNGIIGYTYDAVGNRLNRTSAVAPVPAATYTYDANDRLTTDTYDNDGNTTVSGGNTYGYDFENHLKTQNGGAVTIAYDGDGNRVSKTTGGVTTKYLVDDRNLTGYAQVVEEISGGTVQRVYTYGFSRISEGQATGTSFYGYDGHGNVRLLTDATGAVTDRYDYDAFGNIISQAGNTVNVFLYSGEQNDPNLGFYYLRARYYKADGGRFVTSDLSPGTIFDPRTLHQYVFVANNPSTFVDPSGMQFTLPEGLASSVIISVLSNIALVQVRHVLEGKAPTAAEVLESVGLTAVGSTVGFGVGQQLGGAFVGMLSSRAVGLQANTILKPLLTAIAQRAIESGVSAGTSNLITDVVPDMLKYFFLHENVQITDSLGRTAEVAFSGFVLGGFVATITPRSVGYQISGFGPSFRQEVISFNELASHVTPTVRTFGDVLQEIVNSLFQ